MALSFSTLCICRRDAGGSQAPVPPSQQGVWTAAPLPPARPAQQQQWTAGPLPAPRQQQQAGPSHTALSTSAPAAAPVAMEVVEVAEALPGHARQEGGREAVGEGQGQLNYQKRAPPLIDIDRELVVRPWAEEEQEGCG